MIISHIFTENFNRNKIPIAQKLKNEPDQSSLFSLLKYFGLHQYYNQLKSSGFEDANPLAQLVSIPVRRKFTNQLNLMPGHNNRFMRMFHKLDKMLPRDGKSPLGLTPIDFYDMMKGTNKENQNSSNV
jgi:hypothetical protein